MYSKNWNLDLKEVINNIDNFLKEPNKEVPYLVKLIVILDYLGYSTDIDIIIKMLEDRITKYSSFEPYLDFMKIFSKKINDSIEKKVEYVLKLKNNKFYNKKWFQDVFLVLIIEFQFNSKKEIKGIDPIDINNVFVDDEFWEYYFIYAGTGN